MEMKARPQLFEDLQPTHVKQADFFYTFLID